MDLLTATLKALPQPVVTLPPRVTCAALEHAEIPSAYDLEVPRDLYNEPDVQALRVFKTFGKVRIDITRALSPYEFDCFVELAETQLAAHTEEPAC